ncbi:MAG: hypothetical protein LBT48_08505 [Prevotellaceae bacterium]|jgi:hypothetical protein|nr:hypothetical protein [Prevotellaceae bacterium]
MNCPKCKNPIEDNATICEWCGATIINTDNKPIENKINSFDDELLSLLKKGKKLAAVEFYRKVSGEKSSISYQYIDRLDFFRTHQYATEDQWNKEVEKKQRTNAGCLTVLFIIGLVLTCLGCYMSFSFDVTKSATTIMMIPIGLFFIIIYIIFIIGNKKHKK